jgi:hypothetical protein
VLGFQSGQDDLQSIAEYHDAYRELQSHDIYENFPNCSPINNESAEDGTPDEMPDYFAFFPDSGDSQKAPSMPSPSTFPPMRPQAPPAAKKKGVRADQHDLMLEGPSLWDCMHRSCKHRCFKHINKIALASGIKALRKRVQGSEHKAQYLLDYMIEHEITCGKHKKKKKKRQVEYLAPGVGGEKICPCCFAAAAGFVQLDGQVSITYKRVLSAFNKGDLIIDFRDGRQGKRRKRKFAMEPRIVAWIDGWLPGNHGTSPMNPDELHLNAKSKKDVWVQCCDDFVKEAFLPTEATEADRNRCRPSKTYFLQVMRENYHCVIHKHKKFSQCALCSMFKELTKKCQVPQIIL